MMPFLADAPRTRRERTRRRGRRRPRSKRRARRSPRSAAARRTRSCSPAAGARATTSRSRARRGRPATRDARSTAWSRRDRAQGGARRVRPARARGLPGRADRRRRRAGVVDLDALAAALDDRTAVVSVMLVNNETGVVQPLAEIVRARARPGAAGGRAHRRGAGAAVARRRVRPPRASTWSRSRATSSAGRRASARCVVRDGVALVPLIEGGGHEGERRAGHAERRRDRRVRHRAARHRRAARRGDARASRRCATGSRRASRPRCRASRVNGDPARRVAGLLHCTFAGVEAETLLVALDQHGVLAASGSACSSGAIDPSHVLLAMGIAPRAARCRRCASPSGTRRPTPTSTPRSAVVPKSSRKLRSGVHGARAW